MNNRHVLMIDNYDSFTFNLVYDLEQLGCTVEVYRNDAPLGFLLARIEATGASLVLSPGPGGPRSAGNCIKLVRAATGRCGVLGVCLGHQAIVEAFGGAVGAAETIVHGRASMIDCRPHPLFAGLPPRLKVARYHSLTALAVPETLEVIAGTAEGTVMAVAHRSARIAGMQFHPESILTANGRRLLANALTWLQPARRITDAASA